MPRSRKLVLRKESLTELSSGSLQKVVGASAVCLGETFDCTREIECWNDISFEVCPTVGIEECLRTELLCAIQTVLR